MRGHTTNIAANGLWAPITVVSSTKFTLPGSVGVAVGGATGTIQSFGFDSTYAIPSDGDPRDAASVNVGFEALADRTAWGAAHTGTSWSLTDQIFTVDDDAGTTWSNTTLNNGSYKLLTSATDLLTFRVNTLDVIEINASGTTTLGAGAAYLGVGYKLAGAAFVKVPGSSIFVTAATGLFCLHARLIFNSPISDNSQLDLSLIAYGIASAPTLHLDASATFAARQWRNTA